MLTLQNVGLFLPWEAHGPLSIDALSMISLDKFALGDYPLAVPPSCGKRGTLLTNWTYWDEYGRP